MLQCPNTKIAVVGYGQASHAVGLWASEVGDEKNTTIPADQVMLVATFSDPTRSENAALFPGQVGQVAPRWPKNIGENTARKTPDMLTIAQGAGIGPSRDAIMSYKSLDGRVAQWCLPGDFSCSAPVSISLARTAVEITGIGDLDFTSDPLSMTPTLAKALVRTSLDAASTIAEKDITGSTLFDLNINKDMSLSDRLAQAADPKKKTEQSTPLSVLLRFGSLALSSVVTTAATFITPEVITSLITTGITSLATGGSGAMAMGPELVRNLVGKAVKLIDPVSVVTNVNNTFHVIAREVQVNKDLPQLVLEARTWQALARTGYSTARVATTGETPFAITGDWIVAAARDIQKTQQLQQQKLEKKQSVVDPVSKYDLDLSTGRARLLTKIGKQIASKVNGRGPRTLKLLAAGASTSKDSNSQGPFLGWGVTAPGLSQAEQIAAGADPLLDHPNPAQQLLRFSSPSIIARGAVQ